VPIPKNRKILRLKVPSGLSGTRGVSRSQD
jgi:hypothetical protein